MVELVRFSVLLYERLSRVQFNSNCSNVDDNSDPLFDEHHNDDSGQAFPINTSIYEYSHDGSEYNVEPTDRNLFLSHAYNIYHGFSNPRNEYSCHEQKSIPPDPPVHRELLTDIGYNIDVLYHGFCLDKRTPQSGMGVTQ